MLFDILNDIAAALALSLFILMVAIWAMIFA